MTLRPFALRYLPGPPSNRCDCGDRSETCPKWLLLRSFCRLASRLVPIEEYAEDEQMTATMWNGCESRYIDVCLDARWDMSNVVGAQDDDGRLIRVGVRIDVGERMNGMKVNGVASR